MLFLKSRFDKEWERINKMEIESKAFQRIDDRHYQEQYGLLYEDFLVGSVIMHEQRRKITEIDNMWGSLICMNQNPYYVDKNYVLKMNDGKQIVPNVVTFCIVNGPTVSAMSARAIANLGWDKIKVENPVYIGDTIYSVSEILAKRESKSRTTQGIVKIRTSGYKEADNLLVMICERTFLVPKYKTAKC
jgi:acyl dehydratase